MPRLVCLASYPWWILTFPLYAVDESIQLSPPNEILNLLLELNAVFGVVAVVLVVDVVFLLITIFRLGLHPFHLRQLRPNLHEYLSFGSV